MDYPQGTDIETWTGSEILRDGGAAARLRDVGHEPVPVLVGAERPEREAAADLGPAVLPPGRHPDRPEPGPDRTGQEAAVHQQRRGEHVVVEHDALLPRRPAQ